MSNLSKIDWILITSTILLVFIGLIALWSISFIDAVFSPTNLYKQLIAAVIGIIFMFIIAFYDYRVLANFSTRLYFIGIILLLLVIIVGKTVRGTTGWISVGIFNIQPVEIMKVIMVIFLASFLSRKKNQLSIIVRIIASIFLILIPIFLISKQPDFGSASILVGTWIVMLFVSGLNKQNLIILSLIVIIISGTSWILLKDYQRERIANFINPENDPQGSGYNVIQSMVAVGSGGIFGKGLGHGSQSQLNFLPEKHTDFIFAAICEELGFLGGSVVLLLFAALFFRMKEIAQNARDNFGYLLVIGFMAMFFLEVLVNIGMNLGMAPVTGVPLPLLSYGGSALVSTLCSIGIVLNVWFKKS